MEQVGWLACDNGKTGDGASSLNGSGGAGDRDAFRHSFSRREDRYPGAGRPIRPPSGLGDRPTMSVRDHFQDRTGLCFGGDFSLVDHFMDAPTNVRFGLGLGTAQFIVGCGFCKESAASVVVAKSGDELLQRIETPDEASQAKKVTKQFHSPLQKILCSLNSVARHATHRPIGPLPQDPDRLPACPCGLGSVRRYAPRRCVTSDRIPRAARFPGGPAVCRASWRTLSFCSVHGARSGTPHGVRPGRGEEARLSTRGNTPRSGTGRNPLDQPVNGLGCHLDAVVRRGYVLRQWFDGWLTGRRIRPRRPDSGVAIFFPAISFSAQGGRCPLARRHAT